MTIFQNFLNAKINDPEFSHKMLESFIEVRCSELGISRDFFQVDTESQRDIVSQSLHSMSYIKNGQTSNLISHLNMVLENWTDKAVVYRGSRLPENNSSFKDDIIHTTPLLSIAISYSDGTTNNSTGVGRIMNPCNLGFISAYEVPLNTKSYSNFAFEDFKQGKNPDSTTTLQDLKNDIIGLSKENPDDFRPSEQPSQALEKWYAIAHHKNYYETPIHKDTSVSSLYLKTDRGLLKINTHNPDMQLLLARVQEANLRDFYEINPLQQALHSVQISKENPNNKEYIEIIQKTENLINKTLEDIYQKPFLATKLHDVSFKNDAFTQKNKHLTKSSFVGSSMEQKHIEYPENIQTLINISKDIHFQDFQAVQLHITFLEKKQQFLDKFTQFPTHQENTENKNYHKFNSSL